MFKNRAERTAAKQAVAAELGVTVRTVDRLGVCAKPLESVQKRAENAKNAAEKREKCMKYAEMVKNKKIPLDLAAKECGISTRQMNRYIQKVTQ